MNEDRDSTLSLAFMREHPALAARVLEALPAADAAEVFERAPARLCTGVLGAMLPRQAAACLAVLPDARLLELLAPLGTQATVALLRHLAEPRRKTLIAGLPTGAALASTLLLGYTEDTLGAWADPEVIAFPADTPAGDALARLGQSEGRHAAAFVTAADRRLVGMVDLGDLLRAPAAVALATLMHRPAALLAAHAPLSGSLAHPAWQEASALPVVESGDRLVGVMTRDALARALRRAASLPDEQAADAELPAVLSRGYWHAISGLLESGLALLPRVAPVSGRSDAG